MKAHVFAVFLLSLLVLPGAALANRLALVIGNDSYENLPVLQKARNDATAIADRLRQLGYAVTLLPDADRRGMTKALSDIATRITPDAEVIFYFAGHGVEIAGRNYLIPTDAPAARPEDEAFLTAESIAVDQVLDMFRSRGARITLLILDACRDNPFPKASTRSLGAERGLAPVVAPEGTFILFSAGAGQTALDGMGSGDRDPNSVFTRSLLVRLQETGQPIQDIARTVRRDVETLAASVNHKQRPAYYDELTDDFVLARADSRGAKPIAEAPAPLVAQQDKLGTPPPPADPTDDSENAVAQAQAAADQAAAKATENVFNTAPDDIPATLANDPCFYAGSDFVQLSYPYDVQALLAFAEEHAACESLSQSAIDIAQTIKDVDPALLVPETWRVKRGVSDGHMNVREGRGTGYPVLFQIPEGVGGFEVKICLPPDAGGSKKDWCLIELKGKRGWISSGGIERE